MQLTKKEVQDFQKKIFSWYAKNKRDLPWRCDRNPYHILVSEVMLQQTQVSRVIPKYLAWMEKFPTLESLATASTRDILFYWSGLGYNRRALYLQKFAQEVVQKYSGYIPQDEKKLLSLPGIGEYTAKALLCFAYNQQIAVVDTNIRKVMLVHFAKYIKNGSPKQEKQLVGQLAQQLLPKNKAYEWNQALMDYASAKLRQEKISLPKQSRFKDSDRYYRGQIVKYLLEHPQDCKKNLFTLFAGELSLARFARILTTLEKDKLIVVKKEIVAIAEK